MDLQMFNLLIRIFILSSFFHALIVLKQSDKINLLLKLILFVSAFTEIATIIIMKHHGNIKMCYSLSFFLHQGLWLYLISNVSQSKLIQNTALLIFCTFSVCNMLFFEKTNFNYMTFVVGALLYISIFCFLTYSKLKNESLAFFNSNQFILLGAPILFFFGFSFIFSFQNSAVKSIIVFGKTNLYTAISAFINVSYYCTLNYYIYKEKTLKNA